MIPKFNDLKPPTKERQKILTKPNLYRSPEHCNKIMTYCPSYWVSLIHRFQCLNCGLIVEIEYEDIEVSE